MTRRAAGVPGVTLRWSEGGKGEGEGSILDHEYRTSFVPKAVLFRAMRWEANS